MELDLIVAQESLEEAEPSGLVMEEENVYVTLAGEPYVLLIEETCSGYSENEGESDW